MIPWWAWLLLWLVASVPVAYLVARFIGIGNGPKVLLLVLLLPSSALAQDEKPAPKWAVALAVAGPIADGVSTYYALQQPGVIEGNGFYRQLFGADVKPAEILAFKVAQGVLFGAIVHEAGRKNRKAAIGVAIATAAINFTVSAMNYRNAQQARRVNRGWR